MSDADRQLRQLAKHKDSTVRARASVLAELIASLESQNQALQERAEKAEARGTPEEHVKAAVLDAMQNEYEYEQVIGWVDDAWMDDFALSPAQETDPEPIGEPGVDWVDADHPCKRCGQIMPHTHDLRPTQETDPE